MSMHVLLSSSVFLTVFRSFTERRVEREATVWQKRFSDIIIIVTLVTQGLLSSSSYIAFLLCKFVKTIQEPTFTRWQSSPFKTVPLKNDTLTKCFLNNDSSSASGKKLKGKHKKCDLHTRCISDEQ